MYLPELRHKSPLLSLFTRSLSKKLPGIPWDSSFLFPKIEKNYDIFFAMLIFTYDLEVLLRMPDWRSKTGSSICYIDESFVRSFKNYPAYLRVLERFDCLVINCSETKKFIEENLDINMVVVSSGIDAARFFPGIPPPSRPIDIFGMGRRVEVEHEKYKKLESEDEWLYVYDTGMPGLCHNPSEHRNNLATKMSRSKFFVVNPSKFDCPDDTGGQEEIGFRYFEGSAAGAVLIGRFPDNPNFKEHFPWEDAVVEMPDDPSHIMDFM